MKERWQVRYPDSIALSSGALGISGLLFNVVFPFSAELVSPLRHLISKVLFLTTCLWYCADLDVSHVISSAGLVSVNPTNSVSSLFSNSKGKEYLLLNLEKDPSSRYVIEFF